MIVWPVSSSVRTWNVRSSSERRWIAVPSFSWSPFDLGSIATEITGAGKVLGLEDTGFPGSRNDLTGSGVLQAHHRDDVAGANGRDLLALVGVHPMNT